MIKKCSHSCGYEIFANRIIITLRKHILSATAQFYLAPMGQSSAIGKAKSGFKQMTQESCLKAYSQQHWPIAVYNSGLLIRKPKKKVIWKNKLHVCMVLPSLMLQYMLNGTGLTLRPISSLLGFTYSLLNIGLMNARIGNVAAQKGQTGMVLLITCYLIRLRMIHWSVIPMSPSGHEQIPELKTCWQPLTFHAVPQLPWLWRLFCSI